MRTVMNINVVKCAPHTMQAGTSRSLNLIVESARLAMTRQGSRESTILLTALRINTCEIMTHGYLFST